MNGSGEVVTSDMDLNPDFVERNGIEEVLVRLNPLFDELFGGFIVPQGKGTLGSELM